MRTLLVIKALQWKAYLLLGSIAYNSFADSNIHEHHDHHQREQKAHVHGSSEIMLAVGEGQVEIQFESPANNLVGFEHTAKTEKQINLVKNAKTTLADAGALLTFKGTNCTLASQTVDMGGLIGTEHKNGHDHKHDHNSHEDISALYTFKCESTAKLNRIEVNLFEKFPNISEIKSQWVSNTRQGMTVLSAANNILVLGD